MLNRIPDYIRTVVLDSVGEVTKSRWHGTFRIKCVLSHADRFALERLYSQFIPPDAKDISEDIKVKAAALAELGVRVIDAPEWWESTKHGQLLVDSNPVYDLAILCNNAAEDWSKDLEKVATGDSNAIPKPT